MAEDDPQQKMRAFDDEVALTVAPFYLVEHVAAHFAGRLHRTLPPHQSRNAAVGRGVAA
jgi:hypothetical protein